MSLSVKPSPALKRLALRLREAPKRIQRIAAKNVAAAVEELIDEGFRQRKDPYGKRWTPPKDGGTPMERTGRLRSGFRVRVVPGGAGFSVEITNKAEYAQWLQRGAVGLEARMMVPGARMSATWKRRIDDVYAAAIEEWYRGMRGEFR